MDKDKHIHSHDCNHDSHDIKHDGSCGCDHADDHHHGAEVFAGDGEAPAIVSLTRRLTGGPGLDEALTALVEALNAWCEGQDALVGHIKLQLTAGGEGFWASCTGGAVACRRSAGWGGRTAGPYELRLTAIAYGAGREALAAEAERLLKEGL